MGPFPKIKALPESTNSSEDPAPESVLRQNCAIGLCGSYIIISLAFIVVSALYAKSSSCKIVRKVGKVQEITHLDLLN